MGFLNLEKQFAFYGAYHSNPMNVLIHMLFVWPNFFTSIMMYYNIPMLVFPNFGLLVILLHALFYVSVDKKVGILAALLCFLCYHGASTLALRLGFSLTWKVVLACQLTCWVSQSIGHGVFEKRAPAFMDNFFPAFIMAPFFVLLEALQFFGYEPYPGFHAKVKAMTDAEIKDWQEKKQKKSS